MMTHSNPSAKKTSVLAKPSSTPHVSHDDLLVMSKTTEHSAALHLGSTQINGLDLEVGHLNIQSDYYDSRRFARLYNCYLDYHPDKRDVLIEKLVPRRFPQPFTSMRFPAETLLCLEKSLKSVGFLADGALHLLSTELTSQRFSRFDYFTMVGAVLGLIGTHYVFARHLMDAPLQVLPPKSPTLTMQEHISKLSRIWKHDVAIPVVLTLDVCSFLSAMRKQPEAIVNKIPPLCLSILGSKLLIDSAFRMSTWYSNQGGMKNSNTSHQLAGFLVGNLLLSGGVTFFKKQGVGEVLIGIGFSIVVMNFVRMAINRIKESHLKKNFYNTKKNPLDNNESISLDDFLKDERILRFFSRDSPYDELGLLLSTEEIKIQLKYYGIYRSVKARRHAAPWVWYP